MACRSRPCSKESALTCAPNTWRSAATIRSTVASSIDIASALHPQTILCLTYADRPIEPKFGAPMRLKMTTKPGFKQPKYLTSIQVTNEYQGGYWEDLGYNWFAGV